MRRLYIMMVLVLFLGGYALAAHRMETVLAEGKTVLLALAPVDPRALLMGDYMALRYVVNNDIRKALQAQKDMPNMAAQGGAGGTEANAGAKARAEAEANAKAETEAKSGAKAETEAKSGAKAETEAKSGAKAEAKTDTRAEGHTSQNSRNAEGFAVLRATNDPVPQAASFVRLHDGSPLQADEFLLAYRQRGYEVTSAAPAFYFEEGTAQQYAGAKFGVFKLAADGKTLLVGLR